MADLIEVAKVDWPGADSLQLGSSHLRVCQLRRQDFGHIVKLQL